MINKVSAIAKTPSQKASNRELGLVSAILYSPPPEGSVKSFQESPQRLLLLGSDQSNRHLVFRGPSRFCQGWCQDEVVRLGIVKRPTRNASLDLEIAANYTRILPARAVSGGLELGDLSTWGYMFFRVGASCTRPGGKKKKGASLRAFESFMRKPTSNARFSGETHSNTGPTARRAPRDPHRRFTVMACLVPSSQAVNTLLLKGLVI